jgi:hypothetical protein
MHWFAGRLHEVLDDLTTSGVAVTALSTGDAAETLLELSRAVARLEALQLAVLAHAETVEVAQAFGATSTGAWLAHSTRTPHSRAHGMVRLSRSLDRTHPATMVELQAGRITLAQAEVVTAAVDALPGWVAAPDRARAEKHLLGEATDHDPNRLRVLGRRLLEVVDPAAADAELARRVEAEERAAAARTFLKLWDDGNGTCHGTFRISSLHGAMLTKALHALASPARPDPIDRELDDGGVVRPRLTCEVLGEAFGQYVERFPTKRLPGVAGNSGSVNATVVVTVELQTLLDGLGAGSLDTGGYLSAGQVRRLACQAGIIPAVMGSKSELLDLGRRRLFSRPQRLAMTIRDRGCTVASCDRPAAWCHGHHNMPWSRGGRTTLGNGRLLCPRHHTLVHHPGYTTTDAGHGLINLTRRRT